jgi:hypothetical protein
MGDKRVRERGNSMPRDDEIETKIPKIVGSGGYPDYEKKLQKDNPKAYQFFNRVMSKDAA